MIYGYARVSTKQQAKDGNSLEAQIKQLKETGAEVVYTDSFTGTKMDRPEFDKLLGVLKTGDKLIVTKMDRFARSASQGSEVIESLINNGITVHILNLGVMDNTPTGKLIRTIMLGFAEFERDMIVQRTTEGKAIKKAMGLCNDGRPKIKVDMNLFKKILKKQKEGIMTVKECCEELHISRSKWYSLVQEV